MPHVIFVDRKVVSTVLIIQFTISNIHKGRNSDMSDILFNAL